MPDEQRTPDDGDAVDDASGDGDGSPDPTAASEPEPVEDGGDDDGDPGSAERSELDARESTTDAGELSESDDGTSATERGAGRTAGGGEVTVEREPATQRDASTRQQPRSEDELEREILDAEERIGPSEEYCRHCGAVFDARADDCPHCGSVHPRSVDPPASTRKEPNLAALLSVLLPGAGHLYNEQFGRGMLAFFGTVLLVGGIAFTGLVLNVLVTVASLGTLSFLGTFILILAVLFGWFLPVSVAAWDAYDQAKKLNAG